LYSVIIVRLVGTNYKIICYILPFLLYEGSLFEFNYDMCCLSTVYFLRQLLCLEYLRKLIFYGLVKKLARFSERISLHIRMLHCKSLKTETSSDVWTQMSR